MYVNKGLTVIITCIFPATSCPCKRSMYGTIRCSHNVVVDDVWPWMETFGCSFFMHSGWVSGSNGDAVGVVRAAEFCVTAVGRRRSRKRPAIDEGAESCEDAVMVMTSPLTAKVGLWDTAGEEKRRLQHLNATFLRPASKGKEALSESLQNHFFSPTFNSWGLPAQNPAQSNRKRMKK